MHEDVFDKTQRREVPSDQLQTQNQRHSHLCTGQKRLGGVGQSFSQPQLGRLHLESSITFQSNKRVWKSIFQPTEQVCKNKKYVINLNVTLDDCTYMYLLKKIFTYK